MERACYEEMMSHTFDCRKTAMDYYDELKGTKSSSHEDVTNSFRRLGLQWHPDRNPDNPIEVRACEGSLGLGSRAHSPCPRLCTVSQRRQGGTRVVTVAPDLRAHVKAKKKFDRICEAFDVLSNREFCPHNQPSFSLLPSQTVSPPISLAGPPCSTLRDPARTAMPCLP
jgi:hypothetical protein